MFVRVVLQAVLSMLLPNQEQINSTEVFMALETIRILLVTIILIPMEQVMHLNIKNSKNINGESHLADLL